MKYRVFFLFIFLLSILPAGHTQNLFNPYNLITPMGIASGGNVSIMANDSYNIYNLPSLMDFNSLTCYQFAYSRDSFQDDLVNLAYMQRKQNTPFNYGIKFFYSDFSDDDITYRNYGVNPGLSVSVYKDLSAGVSVVLYKNDFENMDNLAFLSTISLSYGLFQNAVGSVYVKNMGQDLTDFNQYNDKYFLQTGLVYHHVINSLACQVNLDYSQYQDMQVQTALLYDFSRLLGFGVSPVLGINYHEDFDLFNDLSYGVNLSAGQLQAEFGIRFFEGENLYAVAIKHALGGRK